MTSLIARVAELRKLRQDAALTAATLKSRREEFDRDNARLIEVVRGDAAAVQSAETALRAVALEEFNAKGVKQVAPGVEIKMYKEFLIDEKAGLAWAVSKDLCLIPASLDIAAVKKFASVQALPFVLVDEVPRVLLSSDLSKLDLTEPIDLMKALVASLEAV